MCAASCFNCVWRTWALPTSINWWFFIIIHTISNSRWVVIIDNTPATIKLFSLNTLRHQTTSNSDFEHLHSAYYPSNHSHSNASYNKGSVAFIHSICINDMLHVHKFAIPPLLHKKHVWTDQTRSVAYTIRKKYILLPKYAISVLYQVVVLATYMIVAVTANVSSSPQSA